MDTDEPELHPNCTANLNGLELSRKGVTALGSALRIYLSLGSAPLLHEHHATVQNLYHVMCGPPETPPGKPNDLDAVIIVVKNALQSLFRAEASPSTATRQIQDAVTMLSAYAGDLGVPRAEIAKWADDAGLHFTLLESDKT